MSTKNSSAEKGNGENGNGKEKATRNTNPNVTGIRANISNSTFEWFNTAEETSGIEHSVLVEMALLALKGSDEKARKALYDSAINARGGVSVVSMKF